MTGRLIVIRGNGGSGKTSLAHAIRAARPEHSVAIISQDVVRREILDATDDRGGPTAPLLDQMVRYALVHRDVVVEGILGADRYGAMLRDLVADHSGARCFWYDVSFEETLRRHATKPTADSFGEAQMREWWHGTGLIHGLDEQILDESLSLHDALSRVLNACWPQ